VSNKILERRTRDYRDNDRQRLIKLVAYYSDGQREECSFEPNNCAVSCETFYEGGSLKTAGDSTRKDVAANMAIDIAGGTVIEQVIDRLDVMGIDSVNEYPGYVSVLLEGDCSWAIGDAGDTWAGQMHDKEGNEFKVDQWFDTRISAAKDDEADPVVIAGAIAKAVAEVGGFVPSLDACMRACNYAIAQECLDNAGINGMDSSEPEQSRFVAWALMGLYGWTGHQGEDNALYGEEMEKVKGAFLAWAMEHKRLGTSEGRRVS